MRPPIGGVRLEDATYDWLEEIERKMSKLSSERSGVRRFGMNRTIGEILDFVKRAYPEVINDLLNEPIKPSAEDDPAEQAGPPASYRLGYREPREVRPAGTPRRLMHLEPNEKTGTG